MDRHQTFVVLWTELNRIIRGASILTASLGGRASRRTADHIILEKSLDNIELASQTGEVKRRIAHEISCVHIVLKDVLAFEDKVDLSAEDGVVDQRVPNLFVLVIPLQH